MQLSLRTSLKTNGFRTGFRRFPVGFLRFPRFPITFFCVSQCTELKNVVFAADILTNHLISAQECHRRHLRNRRRRSCSAWTRPHGAQVNISRRGFCFLLGNFLGEALDGFIVALRREFLGAFLCEFLLFSCEFLVNFWWTSREYFRSFFFDTVAFKRNAFFHAKSIWNSRALFFRNPFVFTPRRSTCNLLAKSFGIPGRSA